LCEVARNLENEITLIGQSIIEKFKGNPDVFKRSSSSFVQCVTGRGQNNKEGDKKKKYRGTKTQGAKSNSGSACTEGRRKGHELPATHRGGRTIM